MALRQAVETGNVTAQHNIIQRSTITSYLDIEDIQYIMNRIRSNIFESPKGLYLSNTTKGIPRSAHFFIIVPIRYG